MDNKNNTYEDPAYKYMFIVSIDIVLALILGILTNKAVNYIEKKFKIGFYEILIIQILIITLVIFAMKKFAKHIHQEPLDNYSYDIIFVSVYLGSQNNFQKLIKRFD